MRNLKIMLIQAGTSQSAMASAIGMDRTSFNKLLNEGRWPDGRDRMELRNAMIKFLTGQGFGPKTAAEAVDGLSGARANAPRPEMTTSDTEGSDEEKLNMLLRKQQLLPETRKHFGLFRDPFADDVNAPEDVFMTPDIRYIREAMWQTAKHGGFLAVVGESGAGKSTLRRDLNDRIRRDGASILAIEPYVLGMEDNDRTGKTLKAVHIAEAILTTVAPLERPRLSAEARFQQVHQRLKDSLRAGNSHVLIIEEAHGLSIPTIKHLKRFYELEDGFRKLLSILLIGQPELKLKLSERNHEVREVVQRCEIAELTPLDERLEEYFAFKFARIGAKLDQVLEPQALEAIRAKLLFSSKDGKDRISLLYPLAAANLTTACLNLAAQLNAPRVTADLVREV